MSSQKSLIHQTIEKQPGQTATQLANHLGLKPGTVSNLLFVLASKGQLIRVQAPGLQGQPAWRYYPVPQLTVGLPLSATRNGEVMTFKFWGDFHLTKVPATVSELVEILLPHLTTTDRNNILIATTLNRLGVVPEPTT